MASRPAMVNLGRLMAGPGGGLKGDREQPSILNHSWSPLNALSGGGSRPTASPRRLAPAHQAMAQFTDEADHLAIGTAGEGVSIPPFNASRTRRRAAFTISPSISVPTNRRPSPTVATAAGTVPDRRTDRRSGRRGR